MRRKDNVNTELETWTRSIVGKQTTAERSFLEAKGITKDAKKWALLLYCAISDPGSAPEEETLNAKALKLLDADFPRK